MEGQAPFPDLLVGNTLQLVRSSSLKSLVFRNLLWNWNQNNSNIKLKDTVNSAHQKIILSCYQCLVELVRPGFTVHEAPSIWQRVKYRPSGRWGPLLWLCQALLGCWARRWLATFAGNVATCPWQAQCLQRASEIPKSERCKRALRREQIPQIDLALVQRRCCFLCFLGAFWSWQRRDDFRELSGHCTERPKAT